jgi:hypothetical protein
MEIRCDLNRILNLLSRQFEIRFEVAILEAIPGRFTRIAIRSDIPYYAGYGASRGI